MLLSIDRNRARDHTGLADSEHLVGLDAQAPFGMREAVRHRGRCVCFAAWAIHRLEEKFLECELLERRGVELGLRIHELELIPTRQHQLGAGFRTYANPVEARGRL